MSTPGPTIRTFFETRLMNWAAQQTPTIPISFENVRFTKPANGNTPFLECMLIPNVVKSRDLAQTAQTRLGLFQVNCWMPQGEGMGDVEALADSVAALFKPNPKTSPVTIEQHPTINRSVLDDSSWVIVPVLIKYRYEE